LTNLKSQKYNKYSILVAKRVGGNPQIGKGKDERQLIAALQTQGVNK